MEETRPKVLLVDDEATVRDSVKPLLERAGFTVVLAVDGEDALRKVAACEPDLVILDILMPKVDGREVLRRLRQAGNWVHVIVLTQVTGVGERVMALDEGADDYLNKPFEPSELVARIRAVLRRVRPLNSGLQTARRLRCGALLLDRQTRRASMGRKELPLSPKELAVLEYLMLRPGTVVGQDELLEAIWGGQAVVAPATLYTRVNRLRTVLEDDAAEPRFIATSARQGYRFVGSVEIEP